jgi:hypothetical protein
MAQISLLNILGPDGITHIIQNKVRDQKLAYSDGERLWSIPMLKFK